MGHTHMRLAAADEDVLSGALRAAWKFRIEKNAKIREKSPVARGGAANKKRAKRRLSIAAVGNPLRVNSISHAMGCCRQLLRKLTD
jgi:hypothetical protein